MEQLQSDALQLQQIDSTSIFAKIINNNCAFDGSNIIYLAGASIVFHNVFQNSKQFSPRASDHEVTAMAFHKTAQVIIVLVTKSVKELKCYVEFYYSSKKTIIVQINENVAVCDVIFLQKKKVMILGFDLSKQTGIVFIVTTHKKVKTIQLPQRAYKLVGNERKVLLPCAMGCLEFNIETEIIGPVKKYEQYSIKDIVLLQNQGQIIFDREEKLTYFGEGRMIENFKLGQHFQSQNIQYQASIKMGKNLLIAYKNKFQLSYYQIQDSKIQFINNFEYPEKLKANIAHLQCSMDEMNLVMAVQIYHKQQWRMEHFLFNLSVLANQKKFINPFYRMTPNGAEVGEVGSLQKIVPSQIYYLVGPNIVNYSYVQNIEKKHKYPIHQSPKLINVHPLGHQLLCIFQTFIKFYQKIQLQLIQAWTEQYICSAARYTESGLLVLCIYQDNCHQIITYNPNNFRRMKTYQSIYLKHSLSRIDLDQSEAELILYSQKDINVHKFKNGQKLSQFRQKKQVGEATCIEYDHIRKIMLVATKKSLIICRKVEDYCLNFNSQKSINIDAQISCIYIRQNIQTLFLGTSDGRVLHSPYPLNIQQQVQNDQKIFKITFNEIKLHYLAVTDILLTNNSKFLFTSIRGDGLNILKVKRTTTLTGNTNYNPFDISNYNFIQTSSKPYLDTVHEKLKVLLQKRKTIFNELDEFKKQWEGKRLAETKTITLANKKKELASINTTLADINRAKLEHQSLLDELKRLQIATEQKVVDNERAHHKELLTCYDQNQKLKDKKREVVTRCELEYREVMQNCQKNIQQIKSQLQLKFNQFQQNYLLMRQNLLHFGKRITLQKEQDELLKIQETTQVKEKLKKQQQDLYRRNNQLKGQITKNKKQLQRFINRKDFLQNKKRFFIEELKYCGQQQTQLLDIKSALEKELVDLENVTHKKQKRLRKYFIQNQILIKYQLIHDNLIKHSNKEIQFIQTENQKVKSNINQLQKQILLISEEKENHSDELCQKNKIYSTIKQNNRQLKQKYQFLQLQIHELQKEISATNTRQIVMQQQKNEEYMNIYNRYFVSKKIQRLLSYSEKTKDSGASIQSKKNQQRIKEVLHDHKDYLVKNMHLFEKYNTRIIDEIGLTYLKHQTQNYNLISECNIRKEQITKKKRILHQLVDSIRQTSNYMNQLQKDTPTHMNYSHKQNLPKEVPFKIYQQKHQEQLKEREKVDIRKEKSESALWKIKKSSYQVRKMLEIQKVKGIPVQKNEKSRRIQTATLKKKPMESSHQQAFVDQSMDVINPIHYFNDQPKKPQTAANRYRKNKDHVQARQLFSRNKSNSKPTTCTSHSKSKYSVFV